MTSYAAWAKYDVEQELVRLETETGREEAQREQRKQERAKHEVEDSVSKSALESAELLAAHAAVAALKAKRKPRGRGASTNYPVTAAPPPSTNQEQSGPKLAETVDGEAARLQQQAEAFKRKHELLTRILEARRSGERILRATAKETPRDVDSALQHFQRALSAAQELDALVPQLLATEQEASVLMGGQEQQPQAKKSGADAEKHGDHSCGSSCHHGEHDHPKAAKAKTKEAQLPNANDLQAVVKMFFKDVYMGIGTCELEQNRYASASEAFKEALLRDDRHVQAWLQRGRAFELMDATLLAMLHYSRVTALDDQHEEGKEALERVKTRLASQEDPTGEDSYVAKEIHSRTQAPSLHRILQCIRLVLDEANVVMVEGFFKYSIQKYEIALGCLEFLKVHAEELCQGHQLGNALSATVTQLEVTCRLNIASGCHEMQKNQAMALDHCRLILAVDASNAVCHYRMGQLHRSLRQYEAALKHLFTARSCLKATAASEGKDTKELQATVDSEIDKCEFERSQYDLAYIRECIAASKQA